MTSYQQPVLPPPPHRRAKRGWFVLLLLVGFGLSSLLLLALGASVLLLSGSSETLDLFGERIAVVEVHGTIFDAEKWLELLEECEENDNVAAVVLDINSPGGAIAPTQRLCDAVAEIAETGKPVVASMGAVAASGGYLLACAADEIYSMPGTLTGSIGVYVQLMNVSDLLEKLGVEFDVVKKGAFKTAGDFSRDMETHEREMFQAVVDDYYQQFLDAVAENRTKKRLSLARGWSASLPGGAFDGEAEVAELGGMVYPAPSGGSASGVALAAGVVASASQKPSLAGATRSATATPTDATPVKTTKLEIDSHVLEEFASRLTEEEIRFRVSALAEGRIYTGRQAHEVGLVDELGSLDDAIELAGKLANLGEDPTVVHKAPGKKRRSLLGSLKVEAGVFDGSRFLYLCPFAF
jgi:signal peptide peptidase SppA